MSDNDVRPFAKLYRQIWRDPEFVALDEGPQRLYMMLLSHPDITIAGTIPLTYTKWSRLGRNSTPESVRADALALDERCFVIVDEDEQEAFVRSVMRLDILPRRNWQLQKGALRLCQKASSARIRSVMADEIERSIGLFVSNNGVDEEAKQAILNLRSPGPDVEIDVEIYLEMEQNTEHRTQNSELQNSELQSSESRTQNSDSIPLRWGEGSGENQIEADFADEKQRALQALKEQYPDQFTLDSTDSNDSIHLKQNVSGGGGRVTAKIRLVECTNCSNEFETVDPRAKYCSPACKQAFYRKRRRDQP
jgi:hypothetical protein